LNSNFYRMDLADWIFVVLLILPCIAGIVTKCLRKDGDF